MTENTMLTPRQVAELVGVKSLKTIRRWRQAGRLHAVQISTGVYRYRREDVEELLEKCSTRKRIPSLSRTKVEILDSLDLVEDFLETAVEEFGDDEFHEALRLTQEARLKIGELP